ncbi:MFS transporter [Sphingopyxis sp. MG]|nr:hypothetical protein BWD40_03125 [Sphingopyxis granuli]AVA12722.1 MFS transporter [Sphingopyxis sp. MG]
MAWQADKESRVDRSSKWFPYLALTALVLAELSASYETSMVFAALPTLLREFPDPIGVSWLVTGYLVGSAAFAAVCARLGDLYGRARILVIMLMLSAIGSAMAAWAPTLAWLIAGRALQGSAGAVLPLCFGLARLHLPAPMLPIGIGVLAGTASLGAGLGFLAGAIIVDHISWRWMFALSFGLALAGAAIAACFFPLRGAGARPQGDLDVLGGILFVPGVVGILLAATDAFRWGVLDPRSLALGVAALGVLALWARYELRHPAPLIDIRLLARREILLANGVFSMCAFGAMQTTIIVTMLVQQPTWTLVGLGATATAAALVKFPAYAVGTVGSPFGGLLTSRIGGRGAAIWSASIMTGGLLALLADHSSIAILLAFGIVIQIGISMLYATVGNIIVLAAPTDRTSEAAGLSSVLRAIFQAIGSQVVLLTLASSTIALEAGGSPAYPDGRAYVLALIIMAAAGVAAIAMAAALKKEAAAPRPAAA